MSLSVMMTMCLSMVDGTTDCKVSAMYALRTTRNVAMCSNSADAAINNRLLESGKEGWAKGLCFEQDKYSQMVTGAVAWLEKQGYKVTFTTYKAELK